MIRAVVFDLGHTLWDIGPHEDALVAAYAEMRGTLAARLPGGDLPEASTIQRAIRDVLFANAETYFTDGPQLEQPPTLRWVDEGCQTLGLTLDDTLLREITPALFATEAGALICHEGTVEAVRELAAEGYAIGCVTNTLADGGTIRDMLERHGFAQLMSSVVVSADEGWRKPHRSLFEKAMRELRAAPAESVFVGDSPLHDIGGAQAVGMRTVLTRQYKTRPTEGYPAADATIDHLRELAPLLRSWA